MHIPKQFHPTIAGMTLVLILTLGFSACTTANQQTSDEGATDTSQDRPVALDNAVSPTERTTRPLQGNNSYNVGTGGSGGYTTGRDADEEQGPTTASPTTQQGTSGAP